jgi:hypothetical protein
MSQTEGMTQEVEHLLCECEALSSNPSPTKTKHKEAKSNRTKGRVTKVDYSRW